MNLDRTSIVQKIYERLARLEDDREVARLMDQDCTLIDSEMKALRLELSIILNKCPVVSSVLDSNKEE